MEVILENFNPKTSADCPGWGLAGSEIRHPKVPSPTPLSKLLELKSELGLLWEGPPRARGPDDECLFAMCMFCIFSSFAALAAGAAGKRACLLCAAHLLTVMNDSLLPASSPPLCPGGPGSSEVFTNGWKPRQTGIVRPRSGESKEVPSQLAPYRSSAHLSLR